MNNRDLYLNTHSIFKKYKEECKKKECKKNNFLLHVIYISLFIIIFFVYCYVWENNTKNHHIFEDIFFEIAMVGICICILCAFRYHIAYLIQNKKSEAYLDITNVFKKEGIIITEESIKYINRFNDEMVQNILYLDLSKFLYREPYTTIKNMGIWFLGILSFIISNQILTEGIEQLELNIYAMLSIFLFISMEIITIYGIISTLIHMLFDHITLTLYKEALKDMEFHLTIKGGKTM